MMSQFQIMNLVKMANEYDGFISTGFDKIGEDFFKDLNGKLKIIAQVGVGYDNISVKSAESKKIKVTNTPNVLNEAVAETTIPFNISSIKENR
jgi:glyoxylate reductase